MKRGTYRDHEVFRDAAFNIPKSKCEQFPFLITLTLYPHVHNAALASFVPMIWLDQMIGMMRALCEIQFKESCLNTRTARDSPALELYLPICPVQTIHSKVQALLGL